MPPSKKPRIQKRALGLCAKRMGDGSEPSFRKPRVGATSVLSRRVFSGLCFLSQAGSSEGTRLRNSRSKSGCRLQRVGRW